MSSHEIAGKTLWWLTPSQVCSATGITKTARSTKVSMLIRVNIVRAYWWTGDDVEEIQEDATWREQSVNQRHKTNLQKNLDDFPA